jgi:hypothetical protein
MGRTQLHMQMCPGGHNCILQQRPGGHDCICQTNFPYGATTFSLIFIKGISNSGKLNTIISYRMKKWWRHTETFPQNRPADIIA